LLYEQNDHRHRRAPDPQARKLTGLKTKREIVDRALRLLVGAEARNGILRYYGSGIWNVNLKASRANPV
jgi:hypothetical protein